MIIEWTYELLLVISSWVWLYSIKADHTTHLHFYRTADDFATMANVKAHTLNCWQTCYLNWKFNTFCILDIDIKVFFFNETHSWSTGLKQFGVRLYRAPYVHQTYFWEARIICIPRYFCKNHSVEKALEI